MCCSNKDKKYIYFYFCQAVKASKELVECSHQILSSQVHGQQSEALDVCKKDATEKTKDRKTVPKFSNVISCCKYPITNVCACVPDIFVLVNIYLVKLLRVEFIFEGAHVSNHLQGNKSGQDRQHQTLLLIEIICLIVSQFFYEKSLEVLVLKCYAFVFCASTTAFTLPVSGSLALT